MYKTNNNGFSLAEVLMTITIISIALIPIVKSMENNAGLFGKRENMIVERYAAIGKTEEILAMDFADILISSPGSTPRPELSDQLVIAGRTYNRDVYIHYFDGNSDMVADTQLKEIIVTINKYTIKTLISQLDIVQKN